MIPWSRASIRGGALIGPRRGSATAGCAIVLRKARRFVPCGAHSVNPSPPLNSHCEWWMLLLAIGRGGAEWHELQQGGLRAVEGDGDQGIADGHELEAPRAVLGSLLVRRRQRGQHLRGHRERRSGDRPARHRGYPG